MGIPQIITGSENRYVKRYLELADQWNSLGGMEPHRAELVAKSIAQEAKALLSHCYNEIEGTIVFTASYDFRGERSLSFPIG